MHDACPVCEAAAAEPLFEKDAVPYFRCPRCGFVSAVPATNPNLVNRIEDYESAYLDYLSDTLEDRRNLPVLHDWVAGFQPLAGARLLDVGAGGGKFVRHLRSRSIDAVGLEPSDALYERFLAGDAAFLHGTVEELAARTPARSFAVVTALDVIEHVERPDRFLQAISQLLEPGGLLCVSTPDVGSLPARLLGKRWHYYYAYHLSYLSRPTLTRLAGRFGFEHVGFTRMGRYHSVGYALEYFVQFVLRRPHAALPRRLYDWVLPMNLFDVMYIGFRKRGEPLAQGSAAAAPPGSAGSSTA